MADTVARATASRVHDGGVVAEQTFWKGQDNEPVRTSSKLNGRRLNILLSCYACDPELGSEPGMGGNWVLQLARYHDLWVLTEANRFAPALTKYLDRHCPELKSAIHVIGIPRQRFGEKIWQHFFYYWTYRRWQKDALRVARELHSQIEFDLAHQLNMIGYREPGYLWQLGIPFVWGPIGGHAQMPWRFLCALGAKGALHHGLRNCLNAVQMRGSVRVKKAIRRADILLAATQDDQKAIQRIHGRKPTLLNEVGTAPLVSRAEKDFQIGTRPLRVAWCGTFVSRKALPIALKAIQRAARKISVQLDIVGSGECEKLWKSLAEKLGDSSLFIWHGSVPHDDAMDIIRRSDVMLLTSLQEATATVVVEALQFGVPVICHDLCGFGAIVTETAGVKIPVHSPRQSCHAFAEAIVRVSQNPEILRALSEGALQRAREISWPNQTSVMLNCYQQALQLHSLETNQSVS